jgi:peptide/nickel transport system permease protein
VIVAGSLEVATRSSSSRRCRSSGSASRPTSDLGPHPVSTRRTTSTSRRTGPSSGTAIFLAVLSINFIGDGLRDALDPRKVL